MPERGGELPSRVIQSKLRNKYSESPHILFFHSEQVRGSQGATIKSAAEAVPAELIRRFFEVSGAAVAGLHHIAQNLGGRMTIDSLVCMCVSLSIP